MKCLKDTESYQNTLMKALPPGHIWPPAIEESIIKTLVDSIAYDIRTCANDSCDTLDGSFPDSSTYVADWERVLDLPKSYIGRTYFTADDSNADDSLGKLFNNAELPTDINIRVSQVLSFFRNTGFNNDAAYEQLADLFNLTITINTDSTFEVSINIVTGDDEEKIYFKSLAQFFKPVYIRLTIT